MTEKKRPSNPHAWRWESLLNPGYCVKCGDPFKAPEQVDGVKEHKGNYFGECSVRHQDYDNYYEPSEGRRYNHDTATVLDCRFCNGCIVIPNTKMTEHEKSIHPKVCNTCKEKKECKN